MPYRSLPLAVIAVALCSVTVSAATPSAPPAAVHPPAGVAVPSFALVPARAGTSAVFGYQLDANGARGSQYLHGVIVITRLQNNRALISIGPESGAGSAVVVALGTDGTIHAAPPAPADTIGRGSPAPIPPGVRALSALLNAQQAGASWPVAVEAGDAVVPATLMLTGRVAQQGGDRMISADGGGAITLAQVPAAGAQRGGSSRGGGGRGGFGGGMGGGGRRPGGDTGSDAGTGTGTPQRIAATLALHVEASFRGAAFTGARGTEQTTPTQGNDKTPSSASWSIFPY
jgi:uncharacterized membrane protein YgcG